MRRGILVAVAATVLIFAVPPLFGAPKKGDVVTVQVLKAKLMKEPKHIGKVVTDVSRKQFLTLEEAKGSWYEVTTDTGETGWIHKSKVIDGKKQLSSDAGKSGASASQEEIELAGRGFTPEVEKEYRSKNPAMDFDHVDRIEALSVDLEAVATFIAKGKIGGGK